MTPGMMHGSIRALLTWGSLLGLSQAACPYADPDALKEKREDAQSSDFLDQYKVDDSNGYMTSDVGGPIEDQFSLKAGIRGSTLLEDFIFRQKIQHFDHERVSTKTPLPCLRHLLETCSISQDSDVLPPHKVPERAVHARGAGAHGTFTSYADWSNLTAASFLGAAGKKTPVFIRFSTVAGSRGSADTARDVHGFALRL